MQENNKNQNLLFDGKKLNILAASFANVISDNLSAADLAVLSQFFSIVSDSITTIALSKIAADKDKTGVV